MFLFCGCRNAADQSVLNLGAVDPTSIFTEPVNHAFSAVKIAPQVNAADVDAAICFTTGVFFCFFFCFVVSIHLFSFSLPLCIIYC